jgi:glycosyltransferase involved in cell wall biosynthesis
MSQTRVLFLLPYPLHKAPSQRFRVEQLLPLLDAADIQYTLRPFMDEATWQVLYRRGSVPRKAWGIARSFLRRVFTVLLEAPRYDYVFIHREAAPLGPPVFEWMLKWLLGRKMIFDFDDAIWISNTSAENRLAAWLKAHWKTRYCCRWSYKVSAGNDFLCSYARDAGARNVVRVPTVVDTDSRYNRLKEHGGGRPVIGWTGSHSTLKYLDMLLPVLRELREELDFTFLVIADKQPDLALEDWVFVPWNPATEIEDLLRIDIGVMPLTPDRWSEGKCGFKLIQYLGLGIPAVASPVGVNSRIVEEGVSGFLADDPAAWKAALRRLLNDAGLRAQMGAAGRARVLGEYSVAALREPFLSLFR